MEGVSEGLGEAKGKPSWLLLAVPSKAPFLQRDGW